MSVSPPSCGLRAAGTIGATRPSGSSSSRQQAAGSRQQQQQLSVTAGDDERGRRHTDVHTAVSRGHEQRTPPPVSRHAVTSAAAGDSTDGVSPGIGRRGGITRSRPPAARQRRSSVGVICCRAVPPRRTSSPHDHQRMQESTRGAGNYLRMQIPARGRRTRPEDAEPGQRMQNLARGCRIWPEDADSGQRMRNSTRGYRTWPEDT